MVTCVPASSWARTAWPIIPSQASRICSIPSERNPEPALFPQIQTHDLLIAPHIKTALGEHRKRPRMQGVAKNLKLTFSNVPLRCSFDQGEGTLLGQDDEMAVSINQ